ncbi:hypothetical protein GPECTOR_9g619 [Gonium pectorale]|uniref:Alpha-type protein kinase domain-containing protein n=1 Tax=Gonium pectorale TaxID=33097 RepID=A0A150GRV3_GONPE|nr:hypothetical protein GPECTOR_9g619 [Gonium pectorale]|eukprot:KXZ52575.1 hypothetical protein GPECTOR_9g619 [Gonium pectorale]
MENCPLNACWPPGAGPPLQLNAQQHYDILCNTLCRPCGVPLKKFRIHVGIANDTLRRLGRRAEADILKQHSKYVTSRGCAGKSAGKPELHEVDTYLKEEMERFLEGSSRPGDVLVLISGNHGYMPVVRRAVQEFDVQVLQLHPCGANGMGETHRLWLDGEGHDHVAWAAPWADFLSHHARSNYNMRPTEAQEAVLVKEMLRTSIEFERKLGDMGIVLLLDSTHSMQDAIDDVKSKIESELLRGLQERYPVMRDRFSFAVLGYRDVGSKRTRRDGEKVDAQFEVLDFCSDVDQVSAFLKKLKAFEGGDFPEDIAGALMKACELKGWPQQSILFHIFDDPGHGPRFNDTYHPDSPHYTKYRGDDYWERPPPGRRDPWEEAQESLLKLKRDCNVIKYYALTINRKDLTPAPTAKTVEALREIAEGLLSTQAVQLEVDVAMKESWFEEVQMGSNAATLVRVMTGATSRTLGATTSRSRTSFLRTSTATYLRDAKCQPILEGNEAMALDIGSPVVIPSAAAAAPVLPAIAAAKEAQAAQEVAEAKKAWGSGLYQKWQNSDGAAFFDDLKKRFRQDGEVIKVQISQLQPPDDFDDLLWRIDSRAPLDHVIGAFPERSYRVLKTPFAKGGERFAYLARDVSVGEGDLTEAEPNLHVLKEFRLTGKGMLSVSRLELLLSSQTVAGFLAREFNREVQLVAPGEVKLEYLQASLARYFVPETRNRREQLRWFQEMFVLGRFRKFSSNSGYVGQQAIWPSQISTETASHPK